MESEYKYINELQPGQAGAVSDFMKSLSEENAQLFWSCLSRSDQAYLKGIFITIKKLEEPEIEFDDWLNECLRLSREYFAAYIDNYGVSTSVRHINKIIGNVYLPQNIETKITILHPTEALVMVIPVIVDIELNENEEVVGEWKVYLFSNDEIEAPYKII